ncbi:Hypothetical Protein FCC1311_090052 [Hondaea fermentalgiana]|uniref:Uncharacterized protein n=1 Tax=Hondaea fermentalgiana TaxID=2315210 RepID=A0A2R5GPI6_9STRA|nr:Hypothetical Protein FCC1311_090052 [Hondaea fermentalgiana]|eukprot:GBG32780.1 Hypothetical Protein FCC1311_090052 [Hondaea fermentalgiana]
MTELYSEKQRLTAEEGDKLAGKVDKGTSWDGSLPERSKDGTVTFEDEPEFRPNLLPHEVLERGSFGGSYFRNISSGVTNETYKDTWKELPQEWLKDLDVKTHVANTTYDEKVNRYGVNCGAKVDKHDDPFGLQYWEQKGWIEPQDPYGWFCWYTRFVRGRRSPDDQRQISRWKKCAGPTGRWRNNLIGKVLAAGASHDDASVSPVVRQTLQHWGYELTATHLEAGAKKRGASKSSASAKSKDSTTDDDAAVTSKIEQEQEELAKKREASSKNRAARAAKRRKQKEADEEEIDSEMRNSMVRQKKIHKIKK